MTIGELIDSIKDYDRDMEVFVEYDTFSTRCSCCITHLDVINNDEDESYSRGVYIYYK